VYSFVVAIPYPACQCFIELIQTAAFKQGQKATAHCFKPSLDFTFPLGRVRLGVDQADRKAGGGVFKVFTAKGSAVIHIQLSGQTTGGNGIFKGLKIKRQFFRQVKAGIYDQAAVIVDDGDQIGFAHLTVHIDFRAVHHV